jgi:hypothetical protein
MHEIDDGGGQDARSVKSAAVEQHEREPHEVPGGGKETMAAAGEAVLVRCRIRLFDVDALVEARLPRLHNLTERVGGDIGMSIHLRNAALVMSRDRESRVGQAQGLEEPLLQEVLERLTRDDLDEMGDHIDRQAVMPLRAGLIRQGQACQLAYHRFQRAIRIAEQLGLTVQPAHR